MKKKKLKSLRLLKVVLWKLFSEYVRKKYAGQMGWVECYTCEMPYESWKVVQCGHAIGGRHSAVLFDADICRPQCVRCNVFLRGNYPIFTTKLIKENGMEWWEKKLAGASLIVKFTRADIEALIQNYKQKLEGLS